MARADLHYALVLDREIYEASRVEPDLLDPVVRLEGSLPGPAKRVAVVRMYQGPQGYYREHFTITDRAGREVYRSPLQRIELRGEFTEDRFVSTAGDVVLHDSGEHTAHFFIDGEEAGSVPMFIEAGKGGDLRKAIEETFASALKKGDIMWVTVPGTQPASRLVRLKRGLIRGKTARPSSDPARPIWIVWDKPTVYVLDGETEQHVPGLREAGEVVLTVRSKDVRSAVAEVPADVRRVDKGSDEWEQVATKMLSARLNVADEEEAMARWRERCEILALTPRFRDDAAEEEAAPAMAAAAAAPAGNGQAQPAAKAAAEPKVEAGQIDQETYDQLIAEGKPERVATAKAKAAYVKKQKAKLREQPAGGEPAGDGGGAGGDGGGTAAPAGGEADAVEAGGIDQETYDQLVADGTPERVALAKAKRAYVKKQREKQQAG